MRNIVVKTSKNINISGKIADDLKEVFADKDNNGTPDIIDEAVKKAKSETRVEINGKKYNSWEEVPESERKVMDSFKSMGTWFEKAEEPVIETTTRQVKPSSGTLLISEK
jgi:hypothetical protein